MTGSMISRRSFGAMAAVLALGLSLAGCDDAFPDYHYKMTIYAGGKAYSSVRRIEQNEGFSAADSSGRSVQRKLQGQAVVMDLPDGQVVYALLGKPDEPEYALKVPAYALMPLVPAFKRDPRTDDLHVERGTEALDRTADAQRKMVAIKGAQELPRTRPNPDPYRGPRMFDSWPMFVSFSDPTDPKTVREVSPGSIGVERITIEITDDAVTTGIEERLKWLPSMRGELLNQDTVIRPSAPLPGRLGTGDIVVRGEQ